MYEPLKHVKTFFVAGFQHYDGALAFDQLKVGTVLDLVPERDNPHDPDAIEVRYEDIKLGYVPHADNALLSVMAFYGHADVFEARILQVAPEADPWQQVRVGIYVTDKR